MAKQKLTWDLQKDGSRLVATVKETQAVVHFDLTKLKGWDKLAPVLDECEVARDAMYAGFHKKLAQPTGGSAIGVSKYPEAMEALYKNVVETNSYAQRKTAAPKIAVSDVVAGLPEMLDDGTIDEDMYEIMLSKVGQARAQ